MKNETAISGKEAFWKSKGFGTILVFVGLCVVFSLLSSTFLTVANLLNILLQVSTMIIISMGMTWVIITGGIDLSVGASMGLCGVVAAMLIKYCGVPIELGLVISILIGGTVGLANGILVTKVKIPPLLTTIGMSTAMRGLAFLICDGATIFGLPEGFDVIGRGYVGIVPLPVIIAIAVVVVFVFVQQKTAFSLKTYAIGGNEKAAYLSGVKTQQHLIIIYIIIGLLTGLAAFINASRLGVGIASAGENMDFDVVTAVVLGGASIAGGSGKVQKTVLGCLIIGVISNGMMILNVHSFAQQLAKGLILLAAIGADTIRTKKEI
ncbi:ABC transporter permease [Christensenella intestinihominis]|uniref:ABC transporter permease n=1 Tax=Christensenella intestinihominis TaxID=1851429 RepID=UPI00082B2F9D|nr:ABC transporter permease [Christensenella intestinihominis]